MNSISDGREPVGYEGPGFVGTIRAALVIAKAHHPDRWAFDAISHGEHLIWYNLRNARHPWDVDERLGLLPLYSDAIETAERLCDFRDAQTVLRDALVLGAVRAYVRETNTGAKLPISSDAWATENGLEVLQGGWEGIPSQGGRFVILPSADVGRLALPTPPPRRSLVAWTPRLSASSWALPSPAASRSRPSAPRCGSSPRRARWP